MLEKQPMRRSCSGQPCTPGPQGEARSEPQARPSPTLPSFSRVQEKKRTTVQAATLNGAPKACGLISRLAPPPLQGNPETPCGTELARSPRWKRNRHNDEKSEKPNLPCEVMGKLVWMSKDEGGVNGGARQAIKRARAN